MSATAVITDIALGVIEKIRGNSGDVTAKKIADAVAEKVTETVVTVLAVELKAQLSKLGFVLATHELALAAQEVIQAMREAAENPKINIPSLVDVEIVDKFDTSDTPEDK